MAYQINSCDINYAILCGQRIFPHFKQVLFGTIHFMNKKRVVKNFVLSLPGCLKKKNLKFQN